MHLVATPSQKSVLPRAAQPVGSPLSDPGANLILAGVGADTHQRLLPALVPVDMPLGHVLWEAGSPLQHAYFPTTSVVSLLGALSSGATAEIAVVGHEGMLGVSLLMGGGVTMSRAVVRCAGHGFRLPVSALLQEFGHPGPIRRLLLRYTMALLSQMAQTAVCNRHHQLGRQLCRVLLQTLDRHDGDALTLTHEVIAGALGVRRESVSEAALALQKAGLIVYSRGHIAVLDRRGLEGRACECYGVVKAEYDRLLNAGPLPSDLEAPGRRPVPAAAGRMSA